MMFGAVEEPVHWARHIVRTRDLQKESMAIGAVGFTEFVGLPFVHMASPIYLQRKSRRGPTFRETVLVHAVARLAYGSLIPNIQASWVKIGLAGVAQMVRAGCNDLGGTLINENISRAAGASHGQEMTAARFVEFAESLGRPAEQRTTGYGRVGVVRRSNMHDTPRSTDSRPVRIQSSDCTDERHRRRQRPQVRSGRSDPIPSTTRRSPSCSPPHRVRRRAATCSRGGSTS